MTTLEMADIDQVAGQAARVRFSRVLVQIVAAIGFVTGWLPGRVWMGIVFFVLMIRFGFRKGSGRVVEQAPPSS